MELELRINGVVTDQDVAPNESLLSLLHREGYSSVKHGCETGECGACTVLVDGVPRPSCIMLAAQVAGSTIATVESLGTPDTLHPLQATFAEVGATGCGFCAPGMLLSASALLQQNPSPSEAEVRDALSGHLCRCNGYNKPVQAVLRAAAAMRGEDVAPLTYHIEPAAAREMPAPDAGVEEEVPAVSGSGTATAKSGGTATASVTTKIPVITPELLEQMKTPTLPTNASIAPVTRKDLIPRNALSITTGKQRLTGDIELRNMAYGRILTSPHPHAVIRAIDVAQAKALPGVLDVLTYKDVPHIPYARVEWKQGSEQVQDQYCLDYVMRYVGDRVAVVVAETSEIAEQALRLITVEYDVQKPILDQRQALDPQAPRIHQEMESKGILDAARNIAARVRSEVGDVERGFGESDVVVEGEYVLPATQQAPLERHTVLTWLDEQNTLVVRTNSQIPQHVRRTLAKLLGLPPRTIRIEMPSAGGNFGVRQEMGLEDLCALLTLRTRRPVRMEYTRADEFVSGRLRRPYVVRMKTGVKSDGTLVANQMVLLADTGAYGTHALTSPLHGTSAMALYPCTHMRFVAEVLYTNHAPAGAYQGYEPLHEFFAVEAHMDVIAQRLKMDAVELRRKNWIKAGDTYPFTKAVGSHREINTLVESCHLAACVQLVMEKLGWSENREQRKNDRYRRGVGLALSYHADFASSAATSGATIKANEDGSFDVFVSRGENGTQLHTLLTQIAAQTLGVEADNILLYAENTDRAPAEIGVNDVSALYVVGGAVKKAAEQMQRQLLSVAGRLLAVLPEGLKIQQGIIKNASGAQVTVAQVASHAFNEEGRQLMTTASWKAIPPTPFTFAAQGAEVEIDVETGRLRVLKLITAVDAGHVLNALVVEGQIEGAVAQALGVSLSEELLYDQQGALLTTNWQDYHILSASEMPELQTYLLTELPQSNAELFGVKSVASVPLYGVAPAIANAIFDAAHISIAQLPFTPERILRALHAYMSRQAKDA